MIVRLSLTELKHDILVKSEHEVDGLEPEKKYALQIGTDKMDMIERNLLRASSDVTNALRRFMTPDYTALGNNTRELPDNFEWTLSISERRTGCTVQALADACHGYIVNQVLMLYYENKKEEELAKYHGAVANDDMKTIEQLIYSKQPPIFSE